MSLVLHLPLNKNLLGTYSKISTWSKLLPDQISITEDATGFKFNLVKGISGWEKIYTPAITVTPNQPYILSFDYKVNQNYTGYLGSFGVAVCSTIQNSNGNDVNVLGQLEFGTLATNMKHAEIAFVPTTANVFLVANGGRIGDGQENISFYLNNFILSENPINIGLNDYEVTSIGAVSWGNQTGKLGGAAISMGEATQTYKGLSINSNLTDVLTGKYAISVWVKPLGNHVHYNGTVLSSGNWNTANKRWAFGLSQDNSKVDVLCMNYNTYIDCPVPVNTWTHLACVRGDDNIVKLYKNGVYVGQRDCSSDPKFDSDYSNTCVGRETYANGYFSFNGLIQDLRLYDDEISPFEVKRLSHGLVVHYPLNDEYIEGTTNLNTTVNWGNTSGTWGAHKGTWTQYDATNDPVPFNQGEKLDIIYDTSIGSGGGYSATVKSAIPVSANTTYTYSAYMKASDDFAYVTANMLYHYEYDGSTRVTEFGVFSKDRLEPIGDGWYRAWGSFTTQEATKTVNICFFTYPGKDVTYWLGGWQLEQKDHTTPFTPPNTTRATNSFEDDVSGYCYNAERVSTIQTSSETPRYSSSIYFPAKTSYIKLPVIDPTGFKDSWTICGWFKTSAGGWMPWGGGNQNRLNLYFSGSVYNNIGDGGSNPFQDASGNNIPSSITTDNKWHHLCVTGDGTSNVFYFDGVEKGKAKVYRPLISTQYYISGWTSNGDYGFIGNASDFRIYATALSADDVLALYKNAAYIGTEGTLYTSEFKEV